MAKEYLDLEILKADYPAVVSMIEIENQAAYPNAKFVKATVGLFNHEDRNADLMALYDCGTPGELLWVWVSGDITDTKSGGAYIDEYYELPAEKAHNELSLI